jgi:hypothetical protein
MQPRDAFIARERLWLSWRWWRRRWRQHERRRRGRRRCRWSGGPWRRPASTRNPFAALGQAPRAAPLEHSIRGLKAAFGSSTGITGEHAVHAVHHGALVVGLDAPGDGEAALLGAGCLRGVRGPLWRVLTQGIIQRNDALRDRAEHPKVPLVCIDVARVEVVRVDVARVDVARADAARTDAARGHVIFLPATLDRARVAGSPLRCVRLGLRRDYAGRATRESDGGDDGEKVPARHRRPIAMLILLSCTPSNCRNSGTCNKPHCAL